MKLAINLIFSSENFHQSDIYYTWLNLYPGLLAIFSFSSNRKILLKIKVALRSSMNEQVGPQNVLLEVDVKVWNELKWTDLNIVHAEWT